MSISSFQPIYTKVSQSEGSAAYKAMRARAFERFTQVGLPTRKDEDWRYTGMKLLTDTTYGLAMPYNGELEATLLSELKQQKLCLVFVNGSYRADLSRLSLQTGMTLDVTPSPEVLAGVEDECFDAMNMALHTHSYHVRVAAKCDATFYINHIYTHQDQPAMVASRAKFDIETGAKVDVVERFLHVDQSLVFSSHVADIRLASEAQCTYIKDCFGKDEYRHVGTTSARLQDKANFHTTCLQQGGRLGRHDLDIKIQGQHCEATAAGLYLLRRRQHTDHHVRIDHQQPHSNSKQIYKGILDDQSRGIFNGKIYIRQDAQDTDARQLNKNLLLSSEAEADTKPELNIDADDVGCSHGATVGQLDQDEIFYLRSRGLTTEEARSMLCSGFAQEIAHQLESKDLQELVLQRVQDFFVTQRGR